MDEARAAWADGEAGAVAVTGNSVGKGAAGVDEPLQARISKTLAAAKLAVKTRNLRM